MTIPELPGAPHPARPAMTSTRSPSALLVLLLPLFFPLSILVGMYDDGTGLDSTSFEVNADFPAAGAAPGENLATRFAPLSGGVWELKLAEPIAGLEKGKLEVSVRDRQGNVSRIERTFSVGR